MTRTEINIDAFCSNFNVKVERKHPLTLQKAIKYVKYTLEYETAIVKSIKIGKKVIINPGAART